LSPLRPRCDLIGIPYRALVGDKNLAGGPTGWRWKDSPRFGRDGVKIQEEIRSEWDGHITKPNGHALRQRFKTVANRLVYATNAVIRIINGSINPDDLKIGEGAEGPGV
jgi:hypothetical protein